MQLLGSELKKIEGHESFDYDDNRTYELSEDKMHARIVRNEEEQTVIDNNKRISELRQLIPDMQTCGLDVTAEQEELKTLLGL